MIVGLKEREEESAASVIDLYFEFEFYFRLNVSVDLTEILQCERDLSLLLVFWQIVGLIVGARLIVLMDVVGELDQMCRVERAGLHRWTGVVSSAFDEMMGETMLRDDVRFVERAFDEVAGREDGR